MISYTLENGEERHQEAPDTFELPELSLRQNVLPRELVKLIFRISSGDEVDVERMWVIVKHRTENGYVGVLDNDPYSTDELKAGTEVQFGPEHIIQIYEEPANA